jgi:L-alanine-DL-glutamate epimerase-like enolase superfamily enzyme
VRPLKIEKINIYKILIPFSFDFPHSLKKGSSANNIIVEIIADHGEIKGYGEGAPRLYVTGESPESGIQQISHFGQKDFFPWELNDVSQIWDFIDSLPKGKESNAAICAVEMALLDVLGKSQNKSIIEYFPKDFYTSRVYYGAAVPLSNKTGIMEICRLIKQMKINKLKLKMGKDFEQNKEAIETLKVMFGDDCDVRIDINGAWNLELALRHLPLVEEYNVRVIEQPMIPGDPGLGEFAAMIQNDGIILMADESACSLEDVEGIVKEGNYRMINVRLSKCGGFRNSFRIIDYLRTRGLSFQIGCQLGESSILSAGGRVLSLLCRDAKYYDGSYDRFLLKENITKEGVSFGPGGEAGPLDGPGLGVEIDRESLMRLSNGSPTVTISNPL